MKRAARVDSNHASIVGGLRACGMLVQSLAPLGLGTPQLLVYWPNRGKWALLEVMGDGSSPPRTRLSAASQDWHALGWPVAVVKTLEQAIVVMRAG